MLPQLSTLLSCEPVAAPLPGEFLTKGDAVSDRLRRRPLEFTRASFICDFLPNTLPSPASLFDFCTVSGTLHVVVSVATDPPDTHSFRESIAFATTLIHRPGDILYLLHFALDIVPLDLDDLAIDPGDIHGE